MSNSKNTEYFLLDDEKRTLPFNETGTGTLSTNKLGVIGVNTLFMTELSNGAWLVDITNNEVRRVIRIDSDTYAILDEPFTNDLPALSIVDYIPGWKKNARNLSYVIPVYKQDMTTQNPWGEVDGEDFPPGLPMSFSKENRDRSSSMDLVNPVFLDATGTQMAASVMY